MLREDEIIQGFKDDTLNGLIITGEYAYVPLRITGTGKAERYNENGLARIVDRKLEMFGSDEWMQIYKNIPIVLEHPKDDGGNCVRAGYENGLFIGNTIDAYIKGSEIWGIARLYEKEVIEALKSGEELSTSPHFSTKEVLQDDEIYVEIPLNINSLAIVSQGFWDKKSTEPAIDTSEINLTEEVIMEKADSVLEADLNSKTEEEKADSVEEEVKALQDNETQEADKYETLAEEVKKLGEEFSRLAEQHKELEKGDSMEEKEVKKEEEVKVEEKADEASISNINKGVGDSWSEEGRKEAYLNITAQGDTIEEAEAKLAEATQEMSGESETIDDETRTKEDEEREEIVDVIHETADSAEGLNLRVPHFGAKRLKPVYVIKKFAQNNKGYLNEKYHGLLEKIDSKDSVIAREMLDDMVANVKAKNAELLKDKYKSAGLGANGEATLKVFRRF